MATGVTNIDAKFITMDDEAARLKSFQNWPFGDDSKCAPSKMAEAGFFHCPTKHNPDLVQCYVCLKELDGWEPDDNPWEEHKSHSKNCTFAEISKKQRDLTINEVFRVEAARHINLLKIRTELEIQRFIKQAEAARKLLVKLG